MKQLKDLPEVIADMRLVVAELLAVIEYRKGTVPVDTWELRQCLGYVDQNLLAAVSRIKRLELDINTEEKKAAQPEGERL